MPPVLPPTPQRGIVPSVSLPPSHGGDGPLEVPTTEEEERQAKMAHLAGTLEEIRALKKKKSDDPIKSLSALGRWICHVVTPFIDFHEIIDIGPKLWDDENLNADVGKISKEDRDRIRRTYAKLLEFAPTILDDLALLEKLPNADKAIGDVLRFLDLAVGAARRDDTGTLRRAVITFLPHALPPQFLGDPPLDLSETSKACRGFAHVSTGRLLCPRSMHDEFDADPHEFCMKVRSGKTTIPMSKHASYLYPESGYRRTAKRYNLFRGPFLVSVYRHIYTGPCSATKPNPGPHNIGRLSICQAHEFEHVTPEMIAYAVIMARFAICDKESWVLRDGRIKFNVLYHNTVALFEGDINEEWARDTLAWWQQTVWGDNNIYGAGLADGGHNSDYLEEEDSDVEADQ